MRVTGSRPSTPGGAVTRVIPPERAIGCVVYSTTELEEPGVVRRLEGTRAAR
jgi:2-dehydropantoate 2-reductase